MSWTEPYVMVVPRSEEEPRLFAFILPFQPMVQICSLSNNSRHISHYNMTNLRILLVIFQQNIWFILFLKVWLLTLATMLTMVGFMSLFMKAYAMHLIVGKRSLNFVDFTASSTMYIINTMTNQGNKNNLI